MYVCIGNKKKDAMNLKKSKKGYMGDLEGRKGNREMRYYNFNTYIIYLYLKYIHKSLEPLPVLCWYLCQFTFFCVNSSIL